jgi:hypothetical protein
MISTFFAISRPLLKSLIMQFNQRVRHAKTSRYMTGTESGVQTRPMVSESILLQMNWRSWFLAWFQISRMIEQLSLIRQKSMIQHFCSRESIARDGDQHIFAQTCDIQSWMFRKILDHSLVQCDMSCLWGELCRYRPFVQGSQILTFIASFTDLSFIFSVSFLNYWMAT